MQLIKKIGNWLKHVFELEKFDYEKIVIEKEVVDGILELAQMTSPKEFIAFLEGRQRKKVLRIYGLAYQEYFANEHSTLSKINFPITSRIVGSVHSHPGPSNKPSGADLRFFSKRGMVHLIIKSPYREKDIQAYDIKGNKIVFEVVG
ncbi:Mov34/MPN/PAD-1 family protein [Candidatus Woesearchaeota archaeon]|nr:Mov34/MPN/PAD-1 family protein [Candidatus Woesearchaeota archaeon]